MRMLPGERRPELGEVFARMSKNEREARSGAAVEVVFNEKDGILTEKLRDYCKAIERETSARWDWTSTFTGCTYFRVKYDEYSQIQPLLELIKDYDLRHSYGNCFFFNEREIEFAEVRNLCRVNIQ